MTYLLKYFINTFYLVIVTDDFPSSVLKNSNGKWIVNGLRKKDDLIFVIGAIYWN
jgi:hypothetical protein